MVKVMKDESTRRRHAASFHRSLRSVNSAMSASDQSLSSSSASTVFLEQMCAQLVADSAPVASVSTGGVDDSARSRQSRFSKSWDNLLLSEAKAPGDHDPWSDAFSDSDDEEALAVSLADLLPRASREALLASNEKKNTAYHAPPSPPPPSNSSNPSYTPRTLKSILRSCPSTSTSRTSPDLYSPSTTKKHAVPLQGRSSCDNAVVCVVSTKNYDGDQPDQVARLDSPQYRTKKSCSIDHGRACVDGILLSALQGDAHTEVTDMMWTETVKPFRRGVYTGFVDREMRPHGRGTWQALGAGREEQLGGWFYEGSFIPYEYIDKKYNIRDDSSKRGDESANECISSLIPPPPFATAGHDQPPTKEPKHRHEQESRYELGEKLRSRNDIIDPKADDGRTLLRLISNLRIHDGAFIKRSDGGFTKAVVSSRYVDPHRNHEDTLEFLLNAKGEKKIIPQKHWRSCIRIERIPVHHTTKEDGGDDASEVARRKIQNMMQSPRSVKQNVAQRLRRDSSHSRRSSCGSASSTSHSISLKFRVGMPQPRRTSCWSTSSCSSSDSSTAHWT